MVSAYIAAYDVRQMKRAIRARVGNTELLPTLKLAFHAMDGAITSIEAPPPPPERYMFLHVHAVETEWYFEPLPPPAPQIDFVDGASIFEEGTGSIFLEQPETPATLVHMPFDARQAYAIEHYPPNPTTGNHTSPVNAVTAQNEHDIPPHNAMRVGGGTNQPRRALTATEMASIAKIEQIQREQAQSLKDSGASAEPAPVANQPIVHAMPGGPAPFTGVADWVANTIKQIKDQ